MSRVEDVLINRGFSIALINLQGLLNFRDLFFYIMAHLPCDPDYNALHKSIVMGAVEDSLWGGFLCDDDFAVVLHNAEILVQEHINLLLMLHEVINSIVTSKKLKGQKGKVKIFVFGEGSNFATIADTP